MSDKQAARVYAAKIDRELAAHAFDPDFGFADHVTPEDKAEYVAKHIALAEQIEAGELDHNFTVWQRMEYFRTGQSVPFLPA